MIGLRPASLIAVEFFFISLVTIDVLPRTLLVAPGDSPQGTQLQTEKASPSRDGSSARSTRISLDPFVVALRKVESAAQEPIPFRSIRTTGTPGAKHGTASLVLPSADLCEIAVGSAGADSKPGPSYECTWRYAQESDAQNLYEKLELQIVKSGDWRAKRDYGKQALRHAAYDASTDAQVHLTLSLNRTNTVRLVVTPGKTQALSGKSDGVSQVAPRNDNVAPNGAAPVKEEMSMGMLAVASEREGILFVDGERKATMSAGKVVTFKITAGQHFTELRDSIGTKLWEKVVEVPAGRQIAERIESNHIGTIPSSTKEDFVSGETSAPSEVRIKPLSTAGGKDIGALVAHTVFEMVEASKSDFSTIRGTAKDKYTWNISLSLPGFNCSLNSHPDIRGGLRDWGSCSTEVSPDSAEEVYKHVERAVSENMRLMGYSCAVETGNSLNSAAGRTDTLRQQSYRRTFYDPAVTLELTRITWPPVVHLSDTFNMSFMVHAGQRKFHANSMKPKDDFERALYQVVESSQEDFKSLLGKPDFSTQWNSWNVTSPLEGYERCSVTERQGSNSKKQIQYECEAPSRPGQDVAQVFETKVSRLHDALPNWRLRQYSADELKQQIRIYLPWLTPATKLVELDGFFTGVMSTRLLIALLPDRTVFVLGATSGLDKPLFDTPKKCDEGPPPLEGGTADASSGYASADQSIGPRPTSQSAAESLVGEWFVENRNGSATISVSGIKFIATIDQGKANQGNECMTPTGNCIWELAGTIDGLAIKGVVTMPARRNTGNSCESPASTEPFTGAIQSDLERIIINTQVKTWRVDSQQTKKWPWDKPKTQCTEVAVDHTDPFIIILRSNSLRAARGAPSTPLEQRTTGTISNQIDEVIKSGRYAPLPQAESIPNGVSGQPNISIENRTVYPLTIMVAGPVEKSVIVLPGDSQTLALPAGMYRVVGRVSASNVLPFFGTQTYAAGTSYSESFYIK